MFELNFGGRGKGQFAFQNRFPHNTVTVPSPEANPESRSHDQDPSHCIVGEFETPDDYRTTAVFAGPLGVRKLCLSHAEKPTNMKAGCRGSLAFCLLCFSSLYGGRVCKNLWICFCEEPLRLLHA